MNRPQSSLRSINCFAPIGRLRHLVGLLLPEALHLKIIRWRLMRSGELIMEPFSSLGATLIGVRPWHGVTIGRRSYWVSGYCWGRVQIGRYCSISANVSIGVDRHPWPWLSSQSFGTGPVFQENDVDTIIGNDVWIGVNAVIMNGIHVGDGAVIGAGAVVTHDVAPWAIVVGVPACVLKYRFDERTRQRLAAVQWWTMDEDELYRLDTSDVKACLLALESFSDTKGPQGGSNVDEVAG